jgi:ketosteroid isomerase-like protein
MSELPSSKGSGLILTIGLGLVIVIVGLGYLFLFKPQGLSNQSFSFSSSVAQPSPTSPNPSLKPSKPEPPLTRASIDLLLNYLEQATRQKDVDGVLRHIAPDVTVIVHMRQGPHQQSAMLTREEYRKTLTMEFAFPSANDFTRVNTTVSLAPDERSAKVSYKSTQTLLQSNREFKIEGEETFVVRMLGNRPMIVSLEKVVPGDSM